MKKELLWMYLCFFGLVTHSYGNINTINNVTAFLSYPVKPDWLKLEVNNTSTAYNYRPSLLGLDEFTGDRNGNIYFQWYDSDTVTNLTGAKTDQTGATVSTILRTYPATVSGETFDNYNFNHINGTLTIDGSNLPETVIYPTALLTSTVTKTYGDPDYSPDPLNSSTSYSSSNSAVATIVNNKVHIVASGTAIITLAASDGSTIQQVLTVNKAPLSIIADNKSKKNGENNPQFTLSYSGFLNGDTTASLTTAPAVSTTAGTLSPTGTYPITVSGGSSDKYEFHYTNGTMTIIDPTISKVSIVANGTTASSTYTGNYGIELSYDNDPNTYYHSGPIANTSPFILNYRLNGSAVVNGLRYSPKPQSALGRAGDLGKVKISYNTVSDATFQPLMDYDFGQLATAKSFNFPFPITPLNIRIEVLEGIGGYAACSEMEFYTDLIFESKVTKTYGALDYRPVVPNLNESNASYSSSNSAVATIVNNRVHIVASGTSIITIAAPDGSTAQQILTVNKAPLNIIADNKSKNLGENNPQFTFSYSGLLNGDAIGSLTTAPAVSSTALVLSPMGGYDITVSGGSSDKYEFHYTKGIMTVIDPLISKVSVVANGTTASSTHPGNYGIELSYDNNPNTFYHSDFFNGTTCILNYHFNGSAVVNSLIYKTKPLSAPGRAGDFGNVRISYNTVSDATFQPLMNYDFKQLTTDKGVNFPFSITPLNIRIEVLDANSTYAACSEMEFYNGSSYYTTKRYGDANYAPFSNPALSYTSNNSAVATIVNNKVHIVGSGTTIITIAAPDGSTAQETLVVGKAPLTVTANNQSRAYGAVNPTLTLSYSGFVNGDTAGSLTTAPSATTSAVVSSPLGNYDITISGGSSDKYDFTYAAGTLTIGKAPLIVTANNKSRAYGAVNPDLTLSYSGFVNGDMAGSLTTAPSAATSAVVSSPLGNYDITVSGGISDKYDFTYAKGTLTIGKAPLTVTANNQSKVYGAANPVLRLSYSGFVNGDTAGSLTTAPSAATSAVASSPAGSYDITVSGGNSDKYDFTYVKGTLTIGKVPLIVTANNKSRTYGAVNPDFTMSYSGFVNGDTAGSLTTAPSAATSAVTSSSVGSYDITVSGGISDKYDFTYAKGALTVNKAQLTVTAGNKSRAYGAVNPDLTVSYSGFVNGDTAGSLTTAPSATTSAVASSPAGSYDITVSGGISDKYDFTYAKGILTIGKVPLIVTANNKSKAYGAVNPDLTVSYSGFVNGDTAGSLTTAPSAATSAVASSPAGSYDITVSGGISDKYDFTYAKGILTIGKVPLIVTANNKSRAYGAVNPDLTLSYSGFVNGDTAGSLTTAPSAVTSAVASSPAGSYDITVSGGISDKYDFTYAKGILTIGKVPLIVTANNKSRTYGAVNPDLTVSYSGFVNGDTAGSLTTAPSIATSAVASSPAGSYDITVGGGISDKYDFTYAKGTLTVNKAQLTVTVGNQSRAYGVVNPDLTVSYSGFVNGDTAGSLTTAPSATTSAVTSSPAGSYDITVGGGISDKYDFTYAKGTLTVNKAQLTVTAGNQSRAYGAVNPDLTVSYSGFVNGDTAGSLTTVPSAATSAVASSPLGSYDITVSGGTSGNYDFTYVNGILTVNKAQLTVTAGNQSRAYGAVNPDLTVSYSGFVNGDTAGSLTTAPSIATSAVASSSAGSYDITVSGGISDKYDFTYVKGILTVNKAQLTVTAGNQSKAYGAVNPNLTVSYSGFVNGDTAGSLTTAPSAVTSAVASSSAGSYDITVSGGSSDKYDFIYAKGILTIGKVPLIVTADNKSKIYGAANPVLTLSYSGFVNGDTAGSLTTVPSAATSAVASSPAGSYGITVSGGTSGNYDLTYAAGTLIIGKAPLTVRADNKSKVYGAANPVLTLSYSGFVNGDTVGSLTTAPSATTSAVASSSTGTYPITISGGTSGNYDFTYVNGTLTIGKTLLTVTQITVGTKVYPNPVKTINYLMACGENNVNVALSNATNATFTPAANFTINTPKPGIYTQNVTITSEDGSANATYAITVEKPFDFDDIVHQKFNNVLIVNNNPQTNGGYEFVSYQWFKNGQLIGTGQYFSAGDDLGNKLDLTADYSVKMTTKDGKVLQTCPSKMKTQKSLEVKLYPNPVETGKMLTVDADLPEGDLENMQISLYSVTGKLLTTVKSSTAQTQIQLPPSTESNMVLVVIESGNIKKSFKVLVK
ncbi:MBG domain-containing protein [Flavobacterium lipolyticum]|uniref:MBG domain-containing protein n=1 Tax=Flavobacterium lipolyticum TaxID=2893754 RepID=A0ABS8M1W4_9FLAO|nr:MBG domain-containing protein [Flavobacterium sp. F-126]MCC9018825.1 hypothetical protein [Flavobacterium sp. F-126]